MHRSIIVGFAVAIVSLGTFAGADAHIDATQLAAAAKARQSHMQLYSFHLATLGGMAKDEIPYDSATAQTAADSLAALANLSQAGYWLPGSDSASVENTRALPAIWAEGSEIGAKGQAFGEAVMAMQSAAGIDLDALKAAVGPLGAACGACHKDYRQSNN